jgi:formylmethanofuran dehydrogenase subunit E
MKSKLDARLIALMEKATEFHGHLGPFLVIGVRMGNMAKRILKPNIKENKRLQATVKIPLLTPFSCILDGIQTTTQCTVGNQKLKIENSQKEITAHFELQNSNRALKVSVNPKIIEELMNKISEGSTNEELAWNIAHMPENQLFTTEKR